MWAKIQDKTEIFRKIQLSVEFIQVAKIPFLREELGSHPQLSPGHRWLKMQNPRSCLDLLAPISKEGVREPAF